MIINLAVHKGEYLLEFWNLKGFQTFNGLKSNSNTKFDCAKFQIIHDLKYRFALWQFITITMSHVIFYSVECLSWYDETCWNAKKNIKIKMRINISQTSH